MVVNGYNLSNEVVKFGNWVSKKLKCSKDKNNITYIQVIDDNIVNSLFCSGEKEGWDEIDQSLLFRQSDSCDEELFSIHVISDECIFEVEFNGGGDIECRKVKCEVIGTDCPQTNLISGNIINENDLENETDESLIEFIKIDNINQVDLKSKNSFYEELNKIAGELTEFNEQEKLAFVNEMLKYERLFTPKNESANVEPYKLIIKPHANIVRKTYPVPIAHRLKVNKKFKEMIDAKIIERSNSSSCNPLRIVIKDDGSVRVCLDARYVNAIIESDHESPPLISELIQKFHGITMMSTTDLQMGYWQIPLHPDSRKYTAFLYNSKMYQFCRLPFGLKTAGSAFIRALNLSLGNEFDDILTVYIDDFLIATSGNFYDHLRAVSRVFSALQGKNFTLKLEKSLFCRKSVKFLGHELSVDGVQPLQNKLEIIKNFETPKNRVQSQQFIGLCTYYRQFTVKHAELLDPFRELLKGKNS